MNETVAPVVLSGMERMLQSLLKAAGFNPQQFSAGISSFIVKTQQELAGVTGKINAIETRQISIEAKLDAILTHLKGDDHDQDPRTNGFDFGIGNASWTDAGGSGGNGALVNGTGHEAA